MANVHGPMCHNYGVRGYGDPSHGVVIVGIAPGRDEIERSKRPFTGPSGDLMDQLLLFAGWERSKTYCTNVICWWNNSPKDAEIAQCRERFQKELTDLRPKLIITAGVIPSEAVLGAKRRPGQRGAVLWSPRWKCYVLDTHHPSAVLQMQSMDFAQDIIRDFTKIEQVLGWEPGAPHANVDFYTAETLKDFQWWLNTLPRDGRTVTLDIETSNPDAEAIDAYSDQLLTLAISYDDDDSGRETNVVLPTRAIPGCLRSGDHAKSNRAGQPCPDPRCPVGGWGKALEWPTDGVRWTFQSATGDVAGIRAAFDTVLPVRDDTMLMSYCTDERPGNHGLKTNGREWLGFGFWEAEVKPFYRGKMDQLPPEKVEAYNAKDSAATKRLVPIFMKRMQEDGTSKLYESLLLPAHQTFIAAQLHGINVDQKRLQELAYNEWFPRYLETGVQLQKEAHEIGWPTDDINFNSSKQMRSFFFQVMGLDPIKLSKKTGLPSLDKEVLGRMDHPFAAKLRAFRVQDTMIDYVLAVMNNVKYDGLLHSQASVVQTRNGRTSYRDPAMQTLPKDYTVGADYARLREIIIPHDPETHVIVEADFNQIEVWMAWYRSQDKNLYGHLTSGDVHSATAEGAFNTKRTDHTKEAWDVLRQNAKKIRFGLGYGEGAEGLSRPPPVGIGGNKRNAQKFIDQFWATYPDHFRWNQRTQRAIIEEGYITSASGRVMRFPIVLDHKALRQAINFPISADASDTNLYSMIELFHPEDIYEAAVEMRRLNSYLLLNVHDSLVVGVDRRYVPEVVALMRRVMERPKFPGYPSIKVDIKVGPNLGQVEKYVS